MSPFKHLRLHRLTSVSLAALMGLAACGGGGTTTAPVAAPAAVVPSGLTGSVAVGAPITNGKLRVLDATGAVVASDVVIDADGRYANVALSGPAPYRIEACGYAGPNYLCVYSVASAAGTANVTPLTTATVLLAAGAAPDTLMSGTASSLSAATVSTAQDQLRSSLSSVLSAAGVTGAFDFVSGSLDAGSRTGYDGLLDAIGVNVGQDAQPFVQITPRLGTGNLYLEQGVSTGTVTAAAGASSLQLGGIETLFRNMTTAVGSASACAAEATGMQRSMAANARMSIEGPALQGAALVAQGLCSFFGQGFDGAEAMWGATFLSPTLGKCDFSGAAPVCGISFVLKTLQGDVMPVGNGMGVTQEAGVWKFAGDLSPIGIQASARAQRTRRVDTSDASIIEYNRAFSFEVAAEPGLACAKVAQRDASGAVVTLGYYKRHPGATDQRSLALWTSNGMSWGASLDPTAGATRSADDTWIPLPEGSVGDDVIRNFYRGGRSVTVSLFADGNCATPFAIDGRSEFEIDVEGVPPLWSQMPNLPWPELDASTRTTLAALAIDAGAAGSIDVAWTFARGPLGLDGSTVCGSRAACGEGGTGRIGEKALRASARTAAVSLQNNGPTVSATDSKTLALYGRNGEGVSMQSNYEVCPLVGSTLRCQ